MHNNFYFLRKLSEELRDNCVGYRIGPVFSQAKNELIIELYHEAAEQYVKAYLHPDFCCLSFPSDFKRAKRNSVDLFLDTADSAIIDVIQVQNDRSFYFILENDRKLLFKMHGNRANVLLLENDEVKELFRKNLQNDLSISIEDLEKTIKLDEARFRELEGNYQKYFPTMGNSFDDYFKARSYDAATIDEKYNLVCELLDYLEKPEYFLTKSDKELPQLSLYRKAENDHSIQNPSEAVNQFFYSYIRESALTKVKSRQLSTLNQQIRKTKSYIKKTSTRIESLKTAQSYQHLGDLIMANLHVIEPHAKEASLVDFYTQEPISVQLKSTLTPQKNAENYYRKAKRQKIEVDMLNKNLDARKTELTDLEERYQFVQNASEIKEIQRSEPRKSQTVVLPYHQINFMGHDILVGKNASKNEQLTFKVAKKDDLFLHAKDAAGSHVIIRKLGNQNYPKAVIEKAAGFAAYYSKNSQEALCRVLYTPRKYVRKAKGAPAGAVLVDKEKVILVKPEPIN